MPDRASFGERNVAGFDDVRDQLGDYLAGDRRRIDVPVCARGDEFQERVWDPVRQIPYGETVSYGELARDLGDGSSRSIWSKSSSALGALKEVERRRRESVVPSDR